LCFAFFHATYISVDSSDIRAVVSVFPVPNGPPNQLQGSYHAKIGFNELTGEFKMQGTSFIERPDIEGEIAFVDFSGKLDGDTISGTSSPPASDIDNLLWGATPHGTFNLTKIGHDIYIVDDGVYINGVFYSISEFNKLLESAIEITREQSLQQWTLFETVHAEAITFSLIAKYVLPPIGILVVNELNHFISISNIQIPNNNWLFDSIWNRQMVKNHIITQDIADIAGQFGNLECIPASEAIAKELTKRNHNFLYAEIQFEGYRNRNFVISNIHGGSAISDNGYHVGIFYQGNVHCNIHPFGLPQDVWFIDFDGLGIKFQRIRSTPLGPNNFQN